MGDQMVEQTGHTLGPWETGGAYAHGRMSIGVFAGPVQVASVLELPGGEADTNRRVANANLFAAAPELLEACRRAQAVLSAIYGELDTGVLRPDTERFCATAAGLCEVAISKATEAGKEAS